LVELTAVPCVLVKVILPDVAPGIIIATTLVSVLDNTIAGLLQIIKDVAESRPVPLIVTSVPGTPILGVKDVMLTAMDLKLLKLNISGAITQNESLVNIVFIDV